MAVFYLAGYFAQLLMRFILAFTLFMVGFIYPESHIFTRVVNMWKWAGEWRRDLKGHSRAVPFRDVIDASRS
ncbi:hypothetical protein C5O80_17780 [Burkholderia sp. SRS-46]|nr:hypothetical protein C5O80_17780 [Burkholderia sp. SRS-46]